MRYSTVQPLAARCPPTDARHIGLGPGLVDKDQVSDIECRLQRVPTLSSRRDVRTGLFSRHEGLFLSVNLSRRSVFHTVLMLTETASSCRIQARNSSSVISGCLATCAVIAS